MSSVTKPIPNFKVVKRTRKKENVGPLSWIINEVEANSSFKFNLYVKKYRKYKISDVEFIEELETFYFRHKEFNMTLVVKWYTKYGEYGKVTNGIGCYVIDGKEYTIVDNLHIVKIYNYYDAFEERNDDYMVCISPEVEDIESAEKEMERFIKEHDGRKIKIVIGNEIIGYLRERVEETDINKSDYPCAYLVVDVVLKTKDSYAFSWILEHVDDLPIFYP